jgi:hypothetical protein
VTRPTGSLRDFEAGRQLDLLLVSAVTAILLIRFYLAVTGYPQIGGGALHIAHMLWGGLLMLTALVIVFSFLGRGTHQLAAIFGGLGFGTFIDEVGKFITQDNNYFYEPTVSIIYATLILLYLAGRSLHRERLATSRDYLANAVVELLEIVRSDLDRRERERALSYLKRAGEGGGAEAERLAAELAAILRRADVVPEARPGRLRWIASSLKRSYRRIATSRWFARGLILVFVARFLGDLVRLTALTSLLKAEKLRWFRVPLFNTLPLDTSEFGPVHWLQLASNLLAGVFVAVGVFFIFRDRLRSLRMFQRSVLVSLFLTQVFVFFRVEWLGLVGLTFNLLVFTALRFMVEQELRWREAGGAP